MAKNDVTILNNILEKRNISDLSSDENFELFAFDQVLKDYNISDEELLNGKIGGRYGIGLFNFVNDDLVSEDTDISDIKKPIMTTFLILAKSSYTEMYMNQVTKIITDIFDFKKINPDERSFRDIYLELFPRSTMINIVLVSREDTISSLIVQKIDGMKRLISEYIKDVNITSRLVGPGELVTLSYKEKSYTLKLKYDDLVSDGDAYFVLSNLRDYEKFVTDEEGNLRRYIFDFNVRDFQRDSTVNKGIERTLRDNKKADFWWMNNGVTILAKNPTMSRNTLHLDDVQVVNGLQTTHVVHKYLKATGENDKRKIGVKIVTTEDPEIIDAIIRASNSQNGIQNASLRANDGVQRNIESYLLNNDWFYDRRKNYYKNMRKPINRIISIAYLSQAIISMVYREPNKARRNPTSLLKEDKDYELLFGLSNYKIFLFCIRNMKKIDSYMHSSDYGEQYKTNLKWHLATLVMVKLLGKKEYTIQDIESIIDATMETKLIDEAMSELVILADMYIASHGVIFRTMSGNKDFVTYILERVKVDKCK